MVYLFIYSNVFIQGKNIISHWLFCICALFYSIIYIDKLLSIYTPRYFADLTSFIKISMLSTIFLLDIIIIHYTCLCLMLTYFVQAIQQLH